MECATKARILVVDDEAPVSEIISRWLTIEGYECVTVSDGESALRELDSGRFDVALLDVMMPGMSGIDLMTIMKPLFSDVAVVFVTAVDDVDTAQLAAELGAFAYVVKPFERSEIMFAVAGALERRRLRSLLKVFDASERSRRMVEARYRALIHSLPLALAEFTLKTPVPKTASDDEFATRMAQAELSLANARFAHSVGAETPEAILGKTAVEVMGDESGFTQSSAFPGNAEGSGDDRTCAGDGQRGDGGWRNLFFGHGPEQHITSYWLVRLPSSRPTPHIGALRTGASSATYPFTYVRKL